MRYNTSIWGKLVGVNSIILCLVGIGVVAGAIDYCLNNRFGLGEEFENGIKTFGPLALAMLGIISLAPVIANLIKPVIVPLLSGLGADPSIAAAILATDMGGYSIAQSLAITQSSAAFSGLIVASMLGATLVFSIPVALNIIQKKDEVFLLKGLLAGITTIPIGAFVGGMAAGFPLRELALNTIPLIAISLITTFSLVFFAHKTMRLAAHFGKFIIALNILGLAVASVQMLTGLVIIPGIIPLSSGLKTVGIIAIVLMGALPLVKFMTIAAKKPLQIVGLRLGINGDSAAGLLASLVNNIPMLRIFDRMDERGKIINASFMVSGAFILGDHLGFVASVDRSMIGYVMLAKITAALLAIPVALLLAKRQKIIPGSRNPLPGTRLLPVAATEERAIQTDTD